MTETILTFFKKPFFNNKKYIISIWFLIAIVTAVKQYLSDSYNNYKIFKHVFYNTLNGSNLYGSYPDLYFDHNHYGPFFGVLIAPFALLPDWFGTVFWNIAITAFLIYAIFKLPIKEINKVAILWICTNELTTALLSYQFNLVIAGIIVLSFCYILEKKESKSALSIMIGTFVKLYGIVGLSFFFLSKNKTKLILYLLLFALVLFIVPMIIATPEFVIQSYHDWYSRLVVKNKSNLVLYNMQDISVNGMIKRIFNLPNLSSLPVMGIAIVLFGLTYTNVKSYASKNYQLLLLSSTLIFTVIFSSGAESPTYIIAFVGVAIWYVVQPNLLEKKVISLFIFACLLTSLSPTDIFPRTIKEQYIIKYSLKALPCFVVWLTIVWQMIFYDETSFYKEK